jgi:hypothetical protein
LPARTRRHLTAEQKFERTAKAIRTNPEKSNRQIAAQVKVASHPYVAKVRAELEKAGDVETVSTSIDTKGRKQPAKRRGKAGKKSNIEMDVGRDRKSCIALDQKVKNAERELAQWRIDHPVVKSDSAAIPPVPIKAAIHTKPEAKPDAIGLGSTIEREWGEHRGLRAVYVFRNRLPMMHRDGWNGPRATSAIPFAWFCWDRGHRGPTTIDRLSWKQDR